MTSLPWFENQLKKLWSSKALDEVGTLSNVYTGSRVVYSRLGGKTLPKIMRTFWGADFFGHMSKTDLTT